MQEAIVRYAERHEVRGERKLFFRDDFKHGVFFLRFAVETRFLHRTGMSSGG